MNRVNLSSTHEFKMIDMASTTDHIKIDGGYTPEYFLSELAI